MRAYFGKTTRRRLSYLLLVIVICIGFIDNRVQQKEEFSDTRADNLQESTNQNWTHSKEAPNSHHFNRTLKNETEFFDYLKEPSGAKCKKLLTLGGYPCKKFVDGDKQVCLDESVRPPRKECLIYSFGVGDDVSFESSMKSLFDCEIHMYDPTINETWIHEELNATGYFHARGLSGENKVMKLTSPTNKSENTSFLFSTFDVILRDNGHLGRTIHYLKMDIEAAEWEALPVMIDKGLLNNVLQIGIELHSNYIDKLPYQRWLASLQKQYDILSQLEEIGFRKISYRDNINMLSFVYLPFEKSGRPGCGEIFYIRDPYTIKK